MIKVQEYLRTDGSNPYKAWFDKLETQAAAKVVTAKLRLELGNTSSVKWFAGIGEYVIDWGPGYRIYLARDAVSKRISIRPRRCMPNIKNERRPWPQQRK
jgi:putative addiction module killer protein